MAIVEMEVTMMLVDLRLDGTSRDGDSVNG